MNWKCAYKSEHLIITSRFTNAIVFNPPVWDGTDCGLKFCLLLYFPYLGLYICAVTSNTFNDTYSKWKRHIRYGSYVHTFHFISFQRTHISFILWSQQASNWFPWNSIYQMLLFTRHKLKWERINDKMKFSTATKKKNLESWQVFVWI